ncbi:glucose-1-phosphate adenylyltransferase [Entomospira culicis]|uniref:Glucose-1-phosphate adenylyltransferase n=1 Tax=Entomospira culicis TaxID=2719989 RepID=A0A968KZC9_9SPIO|nr:glucose-1-phosphate adenylyltransferase [Entomospira culicis]NIZ18986.1 glucose-1-phosphate adenylyltransferase [Entomospira culicis]NIZ69201.1 glucose-1-phosphate adenylyltransferase [Entomospira culicis]WDI37787.1 glucose-1-phosphate adenylyltransferase [Entomospira culicis]WDI39415.1 glucose-1-phosphate adenylyltransferase [Entomospira culicis]
MQQHNPLAIILGGGQGSRLYPLTEQRSKPAVTFGGKYRLVDIPISNCINAGFNHIFVLTQFNSASLHTHINSAYKFDQFSGGFVEILAAEQTPSSTSWFNGTADAVRKNITHYHPFNPSHYIILSGDQLYQMDLKDFLARHQEQQAEVSIATTCVTREAANELGILKIDEHGQIIDFLEKPGADKDISDMAIPEAYRQKYNIDPAHNYLASMGMYIFNRGTLESSLDNEMLDFGKEVIPHAIKNLKVNAYLYRGYWEDIGTIKSFYEANINLASNLPSFNMYDSLNPLYTRMLNLGPTKFNNSEIINTLICEGSIISQSHIEQSVIGVRSMIADHVHLSGVLMMGADFYETEEQKSANQKNGIPNVGIGSNTQIHRCIIDKNARIGNNCKIGLSPNSLKDGDYNAYIIRDNIIIIRKNAVIADNTLI